MAALDTTGTLTKKYQAQLIPGVEISELISPIDTERVVPLLAAPSPTAFASSPTDYPEKGRLIPISVVKTGSEEEELVLQVLRSGMLTQGAMVQRFEEVDG